MMAQPDISNAEIMDWAVVGGKDSRLKIRLQDGSIIEVYPVLNQILRCGNDPATGYPAYMIQGQLMNRMVEVGPGLRKKNDPKVGIT